MASPSEALLLTASASAALRFLPVVALKMDAAAAAPPPMNVTELGCSLMTFFFTGGQNFLRVPSVKPESLAKRG